MKIAVLSSHTPSLFWFRMDMMKAFSDCGYEVFALGNEPEDKWSTKFKDDGIIYRQIDVQRNGTNPLKDIKALKSIKKILKEIRPEKIFTYQAKTVIYGGIAAKQLGNIEVYPLIAGMGSVFLKNDIKTKVVRKILVTEYKLGMKHSKYAFFQNQDDIDIFRKHKIIKNQIVVFIPGSGVNTDKFNVIEFPDKFGFLCISRLIRDKGVYEYLEACRKIKQKYPDVRCLLVGPYDSNPSAITPEELNGYISDGSIEYFGEQDDVRPYMAQSNVFVLPSYREGTPKTNIEAMACGRAVITTDTTGCRETVANDENGYLVPVKDVDSLCSKMEFFINHPEAARKMGAVGRKKAETVFDVKIVNEIICKTMGITRLNKKK